MREMSVPTGTCVGGGDERGETVSRAPVGSAPNVRTLISPPASQGSPRDRRIEFIGEQRITFFQRIKCGLSFVMSSHSLHLGVGNNTRGQ